MIQQPTPSEVEAALERIVSSPSFEKARRARAFLRFVTEETLAGRERTISGYSIAVAVFGRPTDFDAAHDPLVRVEARQLRSRLTEYYATVGAGDIVRIELRRGSYVPNFRTVARQAPTDAALSAGGQHRLALSSTRLMLVAAALVALVCVVVAVEVVSNTSGGGGDAAGGAPQTAARIRVEPFGPIDVPDTAYLAFGITEEIVTRLGAYRDLKILVAPATDSGTREPFGSGERDADFVLSGSVSTADDSLHVRPRLVETRSGRVIWSAPYDEPLGSDSIWTVVDSVAHTVAATIGEPYGPLFDAEVKRTALATASDPYHCLLRFVFALQVISEAAHGRATDCFEAVVETDPRSSMSWARLAALYRMEYLHGFNARTEAPPPLDRAAEAARRAVDADADNPFAHQEMAFLSLLRDDREGFERSVARTLALDPSADIRAALGINFVKMGEVERGLALIDRSMADSPRAPPFFFLGYVVNALRTRNYEDAYRWAQRMTTRDWPLSQAVLAAAAALAREPQHAREAAKRLLELEPEFATTGRELIGRGRLGEDVESELFHGLALAGISLE